MDQLVPRRRVCCSRLRRSGRLRCSTLWAKTNGHPCRRVQRALDEAGVPYEIVKETPLLHRASQPAVSRRDPVATRTVRAVGARHGAGRAVRDPVAEAVMSTPVDEGSEGNDV
jgi:hypothetical protein